MISGKEAFSKAYDGEEVEYKVIGDNYWCDFSEETWTIEELKSKNFEFRLKPRTINLNGIEVPAPFEPKEGDEIFILSEVHECGYEKLKKWIFSGMTFGAWRTEEEIKQVVEALRNVFNP